MKMKGKGCKMMAEVKAMSAIHTTKMLTLDILEILKKHTDADHRMTQKEIIDALQNEYELSADRKAVKRNLDILTAAGYPVVCGNETVRSVLNSETGKKEDSVMSSGFYYDHEFSESELRLLIDSLLFSKNMPYSQCRQLIEKLQGLSSKHFRTHVRHIRNMPEKRPENRQLFYTIEILDEAITAHKQVSLIYNTFGTDRKLHPNTDRTTGKPRRLVLNPYQIAATNGRYYLICNLDGHDNVANYRVDRITDIELLNTPVKPMKEVQGLENGLDLPKHMAEHIYMFPGPSEKVVIRAQRYLMNDLIDWFGKDISFFNETETTVDAEVTVNSKAMRIWALQYALHVEVLEPLALREEVISDLQEAMKKYTE